MLITDFPADVVSSLDRIAEDYDCVDNHRLALESDENQVAAYERAAYEGCCGSYDFVIIGEDGNRYLAGFNYGH